MIEIIENTRTGIPAVSEVESKKQRALLKKQKQLDGEESSVKLNVANRAGDKDFSVASEVENRAEHFDKPAPTLAVIPKIVLVNGKPQI